MNTNFFLDNKNIFYIEEALPLSVGDIFHFRTGDVKEENYILPFDSDNEFDKYLKERYYNRLKNAKEQFEIFGKGVELIVTERSITVSNVPTYNLDNPAKSCSIKLTVEIYDDSYIRNEKLKKIL